MDQMLPDLVVSVDFGMTCTGVAYQNLAVRSETVQWINKWPGRSQAAENKVPTVLVYPTYAQGGPTSWGFQSEDVAEQLAEDKVYREWFKVLLDGKKLSARQQEEPEKAPRNMEEIKKWYGDYLRKLYDHIEYKLAPHLGGVLWRDAAVEFLFSVPTTWGPPIVERFREIIASSGFGTHRKHSILIDLTEAEAAAAFTSKETPGIFRPRDILLVCDAGGGTTDLSVLRVLNTSGEPLRLEQLDVVQGQSIGSTAIDHDFQELVTKRLEGADKQCALDINIQGAAWEMMKSKEFQNVKCEMGSPDEPPRFKLPVRGLNQSYKDLIAGIEAGFMSFTRGELQKLFDTQIEKIFRLIDRQMETIEQKHPYERIAHLVLSGGLGNSGYVHQQLSDRYQNPDNRRACTQGLQVRISPDPQLAVCKGMIVSRVQKLRSNRSAIGVRCCRASYGSVCKELYDQTNPYHANLSPGPEVDPLNGKLYVTNVVEWYIKKGEPIDGDAPIIRSYKRRVPPTDTQLEVASSLVISEVDARRLPYRVSNDVKHLCDLHATIPSSEGTLHKENILKDLWGKTRKKAVSKTYVRIDFEIKIIIGAADLRFELCMRVQSRNKMINADPTILGRNGMKMSGERSIKVEFAPADDYEPPPPILMSPKSTISPPISPPPSEIGEAIRSPPPVQSPRKYGSHTESAGLIPVSSEYFTDSERRTSYIPYRTQAHEYGSMEDLKRSRNPSQSTISIPSVMISGAGGQTSQMSHLNR